jgi:hypothetical protein
MKEDGQFVRGTGAHYGLLVPDYGGSSPVLSAGLMQRASEGLRERFPWVWCWWGPYTRRWWAYVPGVGLGRLVGAGGPAQLAEEIQRALGRPWR